MREWMKWEWNFEYCELRNVFQRLYTQTAYLYTTESSDNMQKKKKVSYLMRGSLKVRLDDADKINSDVMERIK
jgi:hypothetical protein